MPHDTVSTGLPTDGNMNHPMPPDGVYAYQAQQDPEGASYNPGYGGSYAYSQFASEGGYSGEAYAADFGGLDRGAAGAGPADGVEVMGGAADAAMLAYAAANGDHGDAADNYGSASGSASAADAADAAVSYSWPSDPETMLSMLQQQRQQYRSWVAQCASTALAALDPSYDSNFLHGGSSYQSGGGAGPTGAGPLDGAIPDDVPGLVAAMDVAGSVRQYLLALKAAAESVRDAARAGANFEALSLPLSEGHEDPSEAAAGEAAEAEFVSAAYGVTSAIAAAQGYLTQLAETAAGPAATLVQEVLQLPDMPPPSASGSGPAQEGALGGRLEGPLAQKLERVGAGLCRRLRQEAEALMGLIQWPPPLADGGSGGASGTTAKAEGAAPIAATDGEEAFRGFEMHPIQARRLVGVLTALTHFQMAVEQRIAFYHLLSGQSGGSEGEQQPGGSVASNPAEATEPPAKPLLWAAQALAEPVAVRLRAHFHPAAPTGRLDRPAWLYSTVLEFVRRHGHALSSLDNMLACLQLKPHYNMPAEFARAVQEAVLDLLRDLRIPAILELRNLTAAAAAAGADEAADGGSAAAAAAEAEAADALLLGLMDASAAYDIAMLPLLGATGARAEADAARALAMLSAASSAGGAVHQRRRACDQFDPTAVGTSDMHARYVAVAVAAPLTKQTHGSAGTAMASRPAAAGGPTVLPAWAAAESAAALRTLEAVVYDESSLAPAEEAASRALGGLDDADSPTALRAGGGGSGLQAPWQRETFPPLMAQEAVTLLDGLVARSKWLSADPLRQRDFLESSAGPVLGLLRRRLGRLVDTAVARGEVVSEEGLPKVCAALCAAHFLDDHLHSLLITDLAPLVQALNDIALAVAAVNAAASAAGDDASGPATPSASSITNGGAGVPAGKLGAGGFWSGLIAAAAGGGVGASPARMALRDGVTALAAGASGGAASLASAPAGAGAVLAAPVLGEYVRGFARQHRDGCLKVAREVALGFGRCSVAYRHAIEANPQFPFTPESDAEGDDVSEGGGGFYGVARPASSITPSFAPALMFLQTSLERLSRCCDKATFADIWRGAALSINRFMFNFIATESRFTRAGARQFAADVTGLAHLFVPYSRRGAAAASRPGSFSTAAGGPAASLAAALASGVGGTGASAGGQHFRELQAAARLLCLGDEEAAEVMRRASAAAVAAQAAAAQPGASPAKASIAGRPPRPGSTASPAGSFSHPHPQSHARGDPVRSGMSADPLLSSAGLACLSPLQIMNVIEHRI